MTRRRLARLWCHLRGAHSWEWSAAIGDVECWRCGFRYGRPARPGVWIDARVDDPLDEDEP